MKILLFIIFTVSAFASDKDDYRIGNEWGKKRVTEVSEASARTASLNMGTAFYLGKFANQHVIATNHHVCPKSRDCVGQKARFEILKKSFKVKKFLLTYSEIELSLLVIDVPLKDEALMVGRNFSFDEDVHEGQELLTVGFGTAENPSLHLMGNSDSDCRVFSGAGDYRFMADPDQWQKANYKTWSFALGCDVSHGDSGSAIIDRNSGNVVGIVWTGKFPKPKNIRNSDYLKTLTPDSVEIWNSLTYAVPAKKIAEVLSRELDKLAPESKTIISEILSDR